MISSLRWISLLVILFPALGGCKDAKAPDAEAKNAAAPLENPEQRMGYGLGVSVGRQFRNDKLVVDIDALTRGMRDGYLDQKSHMSDEEIQAAMGLLQKSVVDRQKAAQDEVAEKNRAEGEAFLTKNATAAGVTKTASGLQYKIQTAGTGATPKASDTVRVHYRGTLLDGSEFDSSYSRGEPVTFPVGGVIPGWVEALQLMPVGSKWTLYVPSDLAYGPGGAGERIGPNAMLVFDVELLGIEAQAAP